TRRTGSTSTGRCGDEPPLRALPRSGDGLRGSPAVPGAPDGRGPPRACPRDAVPGVLLADPAGRDALALRCVRAGLAACVMSGDRQQVREAVAAYFGGTLETD